MKAMRPEEVMHQKWMRRAQKGTGVVWGLAILFSAFFFVKLAHPIPKIFDQDIVDAGSSTLVAATMPSSLVDFKIYEKAFQRNGIFERKILNREEGFANGDQKVHTASALSDIKTKYRLVGIILDTHPQAILEDLQKNKTVFLSRGDKIENLILQEVEEGKIILNDDNRSVEILIE
ncbi:MAG: hypothetical protein NUV91_08860 [Candidatus Omnitrophica bacterium]|nr:hypothetical protein [Candidatus Omnitrophota bacterium]